MNFGFDIQEYAVSVLAQRNIPLNRTQLFLTCVKGLVSPMDSRKWPSTWCRTPKRLNTVLGEREEMYWEALTAMKEVPITIIKSWNYHSTLPKAKVTRMFGKPLAIPLVSMGGRYTWDMVVLAYICSDISLPSLMQESVKGKRVEVDTLYPKWVWKCFEKCKHKLTPTNKSFVGVDLIE